MSDSPILSTGSKVLLCDFCANQISSVVPGDTVVWGVLICQTCITRVPEQLADKFFDAAAWPGVFNKEIKK